MRTSRLVKERLHHRFLVTLKDNQGSFAGVLFEVDPQAWILRDAEAIGVGEKQTNVPVDGEILILAADIAYAQRL